MKQVLQNLNTGKLLIKKAPIPMISENTLLIKTTKSLISTGTERMLLEFGNSNYFEKARKNPDKIKMILEKIATDGLNTTYEAIKNKINQPIPLGYSNVGVISKIGSNVSGFKVGDRVVSNGPHADVVKVSSNLCAKIPDRVDDETASFVVISSIGLQGIRLAKPTLGENFVVIGAGLIGLITIQLLRGNGCRVLAIDINQSKLELARKFGAEVCNPINGDNPISKGMKFSSNRGVDGVIITTSTNSNDPVKQAARMSRKRGRIILVGVTGLELNRADFYEKELSFQVSCSYGPGRYDPSYELKGKDYPIGFVRWTEKRNFEAILRMFEDSIIDVKPLISYCFDFDEIEKAYKKLIKEKDIFAIILNYNSEFKERLITKVKLDNEKKFNLTRPVLGFIGAGNYAGRMLIPAFKYASAQLHTIVSAEGLNSVIKGNKAGFKKASSNEEDIILNEEINTVIIVTRHDTHADFVIKALNAGKNVFVEKPLALNLKDLEKIISTYYSTNTSKKAPQLMIGFNRRFSPHVIKIKNLLKNLNEPKSFIFTINAGEIPKDNWIQDSKIGGGRIIGEACHFIDLIRYLSGSKIISVQATRMGDNPYISVTEDKASITISFEDGSFGTIHYFSNGASNFQKERLEIFSNGSILQLDNFIRLKGYKWPGFNRMNLWKQDKGQKACINMFLKGLEDGKAPIPIDEIFEVTRATIEVAEILRNQ